MTYDDSNLLDAIGQIETDNDLDALAAIAGEAGLLPVLDELTECPDLIAAIEAALEQPEAIPAPLSTTKRRTS